MQVLQHVQCPEGSLHVKSSRKSGVHNVRKVLGRPPMSRRDVEFPRRDVKLPSLCHVATWVFPHRDVILTLLCHVATCTVTSRRQIVRLSVTSRRGILTSRRGLLTSRRHFYTSRRHLVTYSVTSRRRSSRRDVI